jgi:MYXO-CTERM domain-containing protein
LSRRRIALRSATSLVALAAALAVPALARANGAFPAVSQLVSDPADPDHLVLRTTFGLLVTLDGGVSWDWTCEAGAGYQDIEPPMTVLAGGAILLGLPDGVSRSDASGCSFEHAAGIDALVYDLARVPSEPKSAVAISGSGTDAELWRSIDGGKSFARVGAVIPDLIPTTVDAAAADAQVVYASGRSGTTGVLLRSSDGGKSFERFTVPGTTAARRPFIAAVDPRDPDTVYVRLDAQSDSPLQVTRDGGKSFVTVLTTTVAISGFAISPDGSTVIASNAYDGTFRAAGDTLDFEKVACSGPTCLSFNQAGLFGCGDQFVNGFVVGRSDDLGASFRRLVDLTCVRGPAACDGETSVGSLCPAAWPGVQQQLGATECLPPEVAPAVDCFGSAGTGEGAAGAVGAAAEGGRAGGASGRAGNDVGPGAQAGTSSGCGCRTASVASRDRTWLLWAMTGVLALWGRRRTRRS